MSASGAAKATCPLLRGADFRDVVGSLDQVRLLNTGRPWRSCNFFYDASGRASPAVVTLDRITVASARQTVAVIRQANKTRPAKYRIPLVSVSGLGDEAWKQSSRQDLRGDSYSDVRLIVRKGNNAFQIYANDEAWLESSLTATKLRQLAKLAVRRI